MGDWRQQFTIGQLMLKRARAVAPDAQCMDLSEDADTFDGPTAQEFDQLVTEVLLPRAHSIVTLNLSYTFLAEGAFASLGRFLRDNTSLRCLDLTYAGLTDGALSRLAADLQQNTTLSTLYLTGDFTDVGLTHLTPFFRCAPLKTLHIQTLRLQDINALEDVLNGLSFHPTLYDFAWRVITEVQATMANALANWLPTIAVTRLSIRYATPTSNSHRAEPDGSWPTEDATLLGRHLATTKRLTMLDVAYARLGVNLVQLCPFLRDNSTLQELWLDGNALSDTTMYHLGDALRGNTELAVLSLGYNPIGDVGFTYLCDCLRGHLGLRELRFRYINHVPTNHKCCSPDTRGTGVTTIPDAVATMLCLQRLVLPSKRCFESEYLRPLCKLPCLIALERTKRAQASPTWTSRLAANAAFVRSRPALATLMLWSARQSPAVRLPTEVWGLVTRQHVL